MAGDRFVTGPGSGDDATIPEGLVTDGDFDAAYLGTPPWDIGRPQDAFVHLAQSGAISGRVLDSGCGTGEHALLAAARGLDATGIDSSPRAISLAKRKAAERGSPARFAVWDALELTALNERFDTVLDCGLFHIFDDDDRARYVEQLGGVLVAGGKYFMLCFSDREPGDWGPRRVTEEELRQSFLAGWTVDSIEPSGLETTLDGHTVDAWFVSVTRSAALED
ncbi:MAG TPA: class I SAM-dependent methyltransferase [Acidimicrobiales bacterium]|nr:class I SAM-dependent methyltransferase [Acidimicrobiales bacterium]